MAKVIAAKAYLGKTVITVCLNPDEPEFIHADGSKHPAANVNGCMPVTDANGLPDYDKPGCTNNWKVQDFTWRGNQRYKPDPANPDEVIRKTNRDYLAEITTALAVPSTTSMDELIGKVI